MENNRNKILDNFTQQLNGKLPVNVANVDSSKIKNIWNHVFDDDVKKDERKSKMIVVLLSKCGFK